MPKRRQGEVPTNGASPFDDAPHWNGTVEQGRARLLNDPVHVEHEAERAQQRNTRVQQVPFTNRLSICIASRVSF